MTHINPMSHRSLCKHLEKETSFLRGNHGQNQFVESSHLL